MATDTCEGEGLPIQWQVQQAAERGTSRAPPIILKYPSEFVKNRSEFMVLLRVGVKFEPPETVFEW